MGNTTLQGFIAAHREELIRRCRAKVITRSPNAAAGDDVDHGVPLFLDQLVNELGHGLSNAEQISQGAIRHGRDLLLRGCTVGQVVHGYGDICQSVTDLAVELTASISADDFRTLNRCLDDAIAGAVTEFSREQEVAREGESQELQTLTSTAITAFEVLQTGSVGIAGRTGTLVHTSLLGIRALIGRSASQVAGLESPPKPVRHH